jgi:hypothetical protein
MIRALFSIAALLVVLYLVMQLGSKQLQSLKPAAAPAPSTSGGSPGAVATPANAATETARRVTDALQQGAEQRASDASR